MIDWMAVKAGYRFERLNWSSSSSSSSFLGSNIKTFWSCKYVVAEHMVGKNK